MKTSATPSSTRESIRRRATREAPQFARQASDSSDEAPRTSAASRAENSSSPTKNVGKRRAPRSPADRSAACRARIRRSAPRASDDAPEQAPVSAHETTTLAWASRHHASSVRREAPKRRTSRVKPSTSATTTHPPSADIAHTTRALPPTTRTPTETPHAAGETCCVIRSDTGQAAQAAPQESTPTTTNGANPAASARPQTPRAERTARDEQHDRFGSGIRRHAAEIRLAAALDARADQLRLSTSSFAGKSPGWKISRAKARRC